MRLPADIANSTVRHRYDLIARDCQYATEAEARGLPAPVVAAAWKQVTAQALDLLDDLLFDKPVNPVS